MTYSLDHDERIPMGVEVKYDEDLDQYVLGADVDDAFVPFAHADGAYVRNLIEAHHNAEQPAEAPAEQPAAPPNSSGVANTAPTDAPAGGSNDPSPVPPEGVAP